MKHKIAKRNINNLRYADDTTLMAESEDELKSLLTKVKEESEKVGLKLNIQKAKIMASGPISSVQFSRSVVSDSLRPHEQQHARLLCPSPSPRVCSDSCPLSWWCRPTISSSVTPFSFCPQSFPASGSFPVSRLFASWGQSIEVSASASVLPMNIQGRFPLQEISFSGFDRLAVQGLSGVFSTTIWKQHFVSTQPSLWSNIHTPLLEKP